MCCDKQKICGFTLIELSIAIVVIGLVIGGIMVGKSMIKAAEIRGAISDLNTVTVAVNTFKIKYNCVPGDCTNSTALFDNSIVAGNGDGDGLIEWSNESMYAIHSLVSAELLEKTFISAWLLGPYMNVNGGRYGILYYQDLYSTFRRRGVTISWFGSGSWTNSQTCGQINTASLPPNDALAIDMKIDDALPSSGSFLAFDGKIEQTPDCPAQVTAPTNCRDAGGANLYQNSDAIGCRTVYYLQGN